MIKSSFAALSAGLLAVGSVLAEDAGFVPLFDGKTTACWTNPYMWGEVKLPDGKANSGFMFRAHVEPNKVFGYQAEVDGVGKRVSGKKGQCANLDRISLFPSSLPDPQSLT